MTKDEALKLALEALEAMNPYPASKEKLRNNAITAIKEALAQPEDHRRGADNQKASEQEPVAWVCHGVNGKHDVDFDENEINAIPVGTMLYTTPPQRTWVGLTPEEVEDAIVESNLLDDYPQDFVAIIEAKLKEKNT